MVDVTFAIFRSIEPHLTRDTLETNFGAASRKPENVTLYRLYLHPAAANQVIPPLGAISRCGVSPHSRHDPCAKSL